eukprot:COSAG01_NODE_95_length_26957_cov_48.328617_10_plen_123_part_00
MLASTHFIWTSLHDFGGSDSLRGNITQANEIPFAAMAPEAETAIWGTGFTPEGIDQNPVGLISLPICHAHCHVTCHHVSSASARAPHSLLMPATAVGGTGNANSSSLPCSSHARPLRCSTNF